MQPNIVSPIAKVQEQVLNAKSILIVTHENPSPDSIAASLSLYLGLQSLGKNVTIACPDEIRIDMSNYIAVNKIQNSLTKRNFVVSLDYIEGSIEKVSYNIQGDKFNLVIETREGFEPFSQDKVSYASSGATADVIFIVDTIHLGGLKTLYESEKVLFAEKTIINIDHHPNNSQFGQVNIINPMASSTSELVAEILSGIGVKLSVDIATNLLNGIYAATNNFSLPHISPRAFEVAAVCIRAGGKRFTSTVQAVSTQTFQTKQVPVNEIPRIRTDIPAVINDQEGVTVIKEEPVTKKTVPVVAMPQSEKKLEEKIQDDWLKPKIFKSKDLS